MNSNIFFLRSSDDGLSVTTTSEGLFDEALIKPHEPSSKENLTPLIVKTSVILWPAIFIFSFEVFELLLPCHLQLCTFPHLCRTEPW